MTRPRYELKCESDGTWMVADLSTGRTADIEGLLTCALNFEEAESLCNMLNRLDRERGNRSDGEA